MSCNSEQRGQVLCEGGPRFRAHKLGAGVGQVMEDDSALDFDVPSLGQGDPRLRAEYLDMLGRMRPSQVGFNPANEPFSERGGQSTEKYQHDSFDKRTFPTVEDKQRSRCSSFAPQFCPEPTKIAAKERLTPSDSHFETWNGGASEERFSQRKGVVM